MITELSFVGELSLSFEGKKWITGFKVSVDHSGTNINLNVINIAIAYLDRFKLMTSECCHAWRQHGHSKSKYSVVYRQCVGCSLSMTCI